MTQLTFLDLCSGIGGFRLGLESAGHKCVGYCEYDKFARASYEAMYDTEGEYDKFARASYEAMYDTEGEWKADDVTKLKPSDVPRADIWCFGFPCQDISVAGKQRGLVGKRSGIYFNIIDLLKELKPSDVPRADIWCFGFPCQDISVAGKQRGLVGKRSGIYFNIIDLLKGKEESDKPTYLFVENVKNLLSINAGFDFATVLSEMGEAGYDCRWQVLNSKDYGVPQNRERVFIIANLRSRGRREILSLRGKNEAALNQIIGGMQGYRVYDSQGVSTTLIGNAGGMGAKTGLYFIDQSKVAPKITDTARCLTARYTAGMVNHTAMNSAVMEVHPVLTPERMEKRQNGRRMITDTARCLTARYTAGMVNHTAMNSAVMEVHPVLTPERMEKRQNGRRMKEDGEPMFTLTSQDRHGVYFCEKPVKSVKVKNATKTGYEEAHLGDGIVLAYPNSDTRRGRVGKGCSQTLDTGCQMWTLMRCGRIRRLTPKECFRLQGFPDELYERAASVNSDSQLQQKLDMKKRIWEMELYLRIRIVILAVEGSEKDVHRH